MVVLNYLYEVKFVGCIECRRVRNDERRFMFIMKEDRNYVYVI